jgi:glycosyltransferase involved in cell wall biosynthesis
MGFDTSDRPLFTIAIPSYNREESLKEILASYLSQCFCDFEIIIGNDYLDKTLTCKRLSVGHDPRVRIINNAKNLGELENMNFLLSQARGQYFTWQFDDDPCSDLFLTEVEKTIKLFDSPDSIFSSFETIYGNKEKKFQFNEKNPSLCFTGHDFVNKYLNKEVTVLGCCGFYRLDFLKSLGGVTRLSSSPIALFSEYLLLVQQISAEKVVYIDNPLVSTRHHSGSWTYHNDDVAIFKEAGLNYIEECYAVLSKSPDIVTIASLLSIIIEFVVATVSVKIWMQGYSGAHQEIKKYVSNIQSLSVLISGDVLVPNLDHELDFKISKSWMYFLKATLKKYVPLSIFSFFGSIKN